MYIICKPLLTTYMVILTFREIDIHFYITERYYLTVKLPVVLLTLMVYINMISYLYLRLTFQDPHILLKAKTFVCVLK